MKRDKAVIDEKLCDRKRNCPAVNSCPCGAITQKKVGLFKAEVPVIDHFKCIGCGRCIPACDKGAIHFK